MSLKVVLLLIIGILGIGGLTAFILIATKPILKLRDETRQPGLIMSDRQGRARWSGAALSEMQALDDVPTGSAHTEKSEQERA